LFTLPDDPREREAYLNRLRLRGDPGSPKARLLAACIGAGGSLVVLFGSFALARQLAEVIGPRDPEIIVWWPMLGLAGAVAMLVALLIAAATGVIAAVIGRAWPWATASWALIAALVFIPALAPPLRSHVTVTADAVRIRCGWPCGAMSRTLPIREVEAVSVGCRYVNRRRRSDFWTLNYVLHARGEAVDLSAARPGGPDGARGWFGRIARLDRQSLSSVPHQVSSRPSVNCVRGLASALGPQDFAAARAMLGISDADWISKYAPASTAWRGAADHGR
jgi:hypothetical protein